HPGVLGLLPTFGAMQEPVNQPFDCTLHHLINHGENPQRFSRFPACNRSLLPTRRGRAGLCWAHPANAIAEGYRRTPRRWTTARAGPAITPARPRGVRVRATSSGWVCRTCGPPSTDTTTR